MSAPRHGPAATPPPPEAFAGAFAVAFEQAGIGIAISQPDGRLLCANRALCEMLGYAEAELHGTGLAAVFHPDDRPRAAAPVARSALAVERLEVRLHHKSGRILWALHGRTAAFDAAGAPVYVVDQLQDLSERRRAEKEIVLLNNLLEQRIRRRTAELEESNEDLRDFAYSLAHDLRGPLASIDGFSAQLQRQLQDRLDPQAAHYLRRVRAGARQMSELTDGLLALADVSRSALQHDLVDLSAIASGILERLHETEPARAVQATVQATPPARGDGRLLAVVLENLLGNAWKFTARRANAHIEFGAQVLEGSARYFVRDDGAGFDPAYAGKLFAPFQRLHTAAEFEGTGIGLALVRKIVARHGGRVGAESRPGEGACFWFTLEGATAASR